MSSIEKIYKAFKVIESEAEYEEALSLGEELMDAEPDSPQANALEVLALLIEKYEDVHYPIDAPTLSEAMQFRMEQQGLTQTDLAKLLRSKSRASEIKNGKRKPTLAQAALLHKEWHIPAASIFSSVQKTASD